MVNATEPPRKRIDCRCNSLRRNSLQRSSFIFNRAREIRACARFAITNGPGERRQRLLKTQPAWIHWRFRPTSDSLPSWQSRQAERSRSLEANPLTPVALPVCGSPGTSEPPNIECLGRRSICCLLGVAAIVVRPAGKPSRESTIGEICKRYGQKDNRGKIRLASSPDGYSRHREQECGGT
jgi:hypothetical protein